MDLTNIELDYCIDMVQKGHVIDGLAKRFGVSSDSLMHYMKLRHFDKELDENAARNST